MLIILLQKANLCKYKRKIIAQKQIKYHQHKQKKNNNDKFNNHKGKIIQLLDQKFKIINPPIRMRKN